MQPVKTAVVGCGNISSIYLENAARWDVLDLVACANRTLPRAQSQAAKFGVPRALSIAMHELACDTSLRYRLADEARRSVGCHFDADRMIESVARREGARPPDLRELQADAP